MVTLPSAIAKIKSRRLILMTNVEGVYDDQKKLISEIKPFDLEISSNESCSRGNDSKN